MFALNFYFNLNGMIYKVRGHTYFNLNHSKFTHHGKKRKEKDLFSVAK